MSQRVRDKWHINLNCAASWTATIQGFPKVSLLAAANGKKNLIGTSGKEIETFGDPTEPLKSYRYPEKFFSGFGSVYPLNLTAILPLTLSIIGVTAVKDVSFSLFWRSHTPFGAPAPLRASRKREGVRGGEAHSAVKGYKGLVKSGEYTLLNLTINSALQEFPWFFVARRDTHTICCGHGLEKSHI